MAETHFWLHLLGQYGYAVVLAGTFLEGETVLVLAGTLAHEGYFSLPVIALCAFAGSLASDQLMFFIGRRYGTDFLRKRPALHRAAAKVERLVKRHEDLLILGFRFVWGIRNAAPLILGAHGVNARKFFILNLLSAAVWAAFFSLVGYGLGELAERVFGRLGLEHHFALWSFMLLALSAAAVSGIWIWRAKRDAPQADRRPRRGSGGKRGQSS